MLNKLLLTKGEKKEPIIVTGMYSFDVTIGHYKGSNFDEYGYGTKPIANNYGSCSKPNDIDLFRLIVTSNNKWTWELYTSNADLFKQAKTISVKVYVTNGGISGSNTYTLTSPNAKGYSGSAIANNLIEIMFQESGNTSKITVTYEYEEYV